MEKQEHVLIKKYLEGHSLVESNITSYNNFIEKGIQEIVDDLSHSIEDDEDETEIKVKLGKVEVGKPEIIETDGSHNLLSPAEARLRGITYSAPVSLEISVTQNGGTDSSRVDIGKIPVMVKSNKCNLFGLSKEELQEKYFDPLDQGGYFIINGNERVMVMAEDLAENQPFIGNAKEGIMLRLFSLRGAYRIPVSITQTNEGIMEVSFSRFKNIPAIVLLKALGMTQESEIAQRIGKEKDNLIVNFYEFANIATKDDALLSIAEKTSLQGTQKEMFDRVKQRIDSYFLPHVGLKKEDRMTKAITLCKLIKQYITASENPHLKTDKDHYANKRVRLSGDLLSSLFRVNLSIFVRDIKYSLQKISKRKKFYSIKTIAKSTLFSHRIESAIATGSWIGERTGVTQNMDKNNFLAMVSQLQRVSSMLPGEQENFAARTLHPTHYGRFCPIETPEGTEIGLRKNLAILSRISTRVNMDGGKFVQALEKHGLDRGGSPGVDVFFNGMYVGSVKDKEEFMRNVKEARRKGEFDIELSVACNEDTETIVLSTEIGRVLRPVIVADKGVPRLKEEHLNLLKEGKLKWDNLIEQGIVEYLDAYEEESALVALEKELLTPNHTHLEIDKMDLLGVITSLVPYANHDQSARLNRGSKTQKQALGLYAANYHVRLDTDVSILHYPQKPIVRTFVYDTLNIYPAGQNFIVAVMTNDGYNVEDALIINEGSVQRGLGRSTYFRPYTTIELNYAGGLKDEITIPTKDVSGYRTEELYKYLEEDGIVFPEAQLDSGYVITGRTSPPKFLSEAREITIRTKKENSTVMRHEEKGIVDGVFVTVDEEGNKVVQVRTRDQRLPEPGDKFATTHGQKGVLGRILPENNVPFTATGMRPNLIFNPHGIPGRMTVGYLLELLAGKVGSLSGRSVDGTPFSGESKEELESQLKKLGFRYDGKETMYDAITGKKMVAKIYIGCMYYEKLRYMVKNRIHARASGKVALLTRQPVEGRSKGGALRLGEMEQQALVAHGASLLLKERYDSDKVVLHVCSRCGALAVNDSIRNKIYCPICSSTEAEPIEVSYAFKLLMEELQSLHIQTTMELKNKYE